MLNKILKFGAVGAVAMIFVACSKPPFEVTYLIPEANRLSFSQNKPMGCMLVGEKDGVARVGKTEATISKLEESAQNDMLNKSAGLLTVGGNQDKNKRMVVYLSKKEWQCGKYEKPCKNQENPKIKEVSALKVSGEIYECSF